MGEYDPSSATITLWVDSIYGGKTSSLIRLPVLAEALLARTLFHEVGHHRLRHSHGLNRKKREALAEEYCRERLRSAFRPWLQVVKPFFKAFRLVSRS